MLAFIEKCIHHFSFIPTIVKNKLHAFAYTWWPSYFSPLCRPGDFLCHETKGAVKLEEILAKPLMQGLDWCSEHSNTCLAVTTVGAALATGVGMYFCFCRNKTPKTHSQQISAASLTHRPN